MKERGITELISLLSDLTGYVLSDSHPRVQSEMIVKKVREIFDVDAAIIRLIEGNELVVLASDGVPSENLLPHLQADEGMGSEIIKTRSPKKIFDVFADPLTVKMLNRNKNEFRFISYAGAPLIINDRVIGIIGIYRINIKADFSESELEQLQLVANQVAIRLENVRLYNDLRKNTDSLKKEINQREITERELRSAKQDAEQSDNLKSEFLAMVSHEIRTPVNTIINYSTLMKNEFANETEENNIFFNAIDNSCRRLVRTIDLIVNMSEIQIGSYKYNPKSLPLHSALIAPSLLAHQQSALKKGLSFKYENNLSGGEKTVYVDEYTFAVVIDNLLNNAVKFTEKGNITLLLENGGDFSNVIIRDTGIGIESSFLERIFDPFVQEDEGYTRRYEGTGLGLAIVKSYCDLNKINIDVASSKGKGTEFILRIPPC